MNIMVCSIVVGHKLQGIPGEGVATVVVNGLEGRKGKEAHALARCHARQLEADAGTERIEQEALQRVVIQRAIRIRDVQAVVA